MIRRSSINDDNRRAHHYLLAVFWPLWCSVRQLRYEIVFTWCCKKSRVGRKTHSSLQDMTHILDRIGIQTILYFQYIAYPWPKCAFIWFAPKLTENHFAQDNMLGKLLVWNTQSHLEMLSFILRYLFFLESMEHPHDHNNKMDQEEHRLP